HTSYSRDWSSDVCSTDLRSRSRRRRGRFRRSRAPPPRPAPTSPSDPGVTMSSHAPPSFRAGELSDARLAAALKTLELTVRRRLRAEERRVGHVAPGEWLG